MSKSWSSGSTRAWRKTRERILTRDNYTCQLKLDGCTTKATHVHHIAGKTAGDNQDLLVASCRHCNLTTGDPTKHNPPAKPVTKW